MIEWTVQCNAIRLEQFLSSWIALTGHTGIGQFICYSSDMYLNPLKYHYVQNSDIFVFHIHSFMIKNVVSIPQCKFTAIQDALNAKKLLRSDNKTLSF